MSEGLLILLPSLEKRPDKTFIARIERLRLSRLPFQFIANFIEKASRLYEQERRAASAALRFRCTLGRLGWVEGVV
jgi:hypothetical protein